jgi:hypothetical protein
MSSTTNFYRNPAQPVSTPGNSVQSINNLEGDYTMDTSNENHTESGIIEGLESLDVTSTSATTPSTPPGEIPAGSYLSTITRVDKTTHPEGTYDIVKMEITVQGGQYSGFVLKKSYHQKTLKAVNFFKREMEEIGVTLKKRRQLDDLCDTLTGTNVIADIVPSDSGNQAIYLKNSNTKKNVVPVDPDALWMD